MGIVEFLEARIAEDEARVDAIHSLATERYGGVPVYRNVSGSPARILREVAAKRAIIKAYVDADIKAHDTYNFHEDILNGESNGLETAVEALAICWSDHPDFNEEWRP